MSLVELEQLVSGLSESERKTLRDILHATEEGVSLDELHAMNAAIDEALKEPSAAMPADQVFAELKALYPLSNAASSKA